LRTLFVDTGAFLAKEIAADQHHRRATDFWNILKDQGAQLCSSQHVLDETATLLARRTTYAWAADWGRDVLAAGFRWLTADENDLLGAFAQMRKYADQGVSFTDCLSFVLMQKERVRDVFGFDRHFDAAGFRIWPEVS
jgi:predicted nucleic acid-binding protein